MEQPAAPYIPDITDTAIIRRILEACFQKPAILPPSKADPRRALSLVCWGWRNLVLSTPEFWNRIIFLPKLFSDSVRQLHIFHTYVQRSGSYPLSFFFVTELEWHLRENPNLDELRVEELVYGRTTFSTVESVIGPYVPRIRHLDCVISREENTQFLLDIPQGSFQMLEMINITFVNDFATRHFPFTIQESYNFQAFRSLPNLRHARIRILNGVHPLDLHLPWRQMVTLNLGNTPMPSDVFIRIMRQSAPSLVDGYFHLEPDICSSRFLETCLPVNMPRLIRFHLRLINHSPHPDILLLLRLPALKEMWIDSADIDQPFQWDIPRYTSFLETSTASVEKLMLTNLSLEPAANTGPTEKSFSRATSSQELNELFKVVNNLSTLCLPWSILLHVQTVEKIANGELLPRLQILQVATRNADIILNMIRTRNIILGSRSTSTPPFPITSLTLTLPATSAVERENMEKDVTSLGLSGEWRFTFIPLSSFYFAN